MPEGRTAIPLPLQRQVKVEAGHRCAIPTCKSTPIELAHIVPWEKVREHTFENLIALCPTCHTRYDSGNQIDRLSMKQYKANLGVISGRYGETERRVLAHFAEDPTAESLWLTGAWELHLMYLLKDGLIEQVRRPVSMSVSGVKLAEEYRITDLGRAFVARWVAAEPVSEDSE